MLWFATIIMIIVIINFCRKRHGHQIPVKANISLDLLIHKIGIDAIKDIYTLSLYSDIYGDNCYDEYIYNICLIYEFQTYYSWKQILLNFEIVFYDSISRFN